MIVSNIKILICDDHPICCSGLRASIDTVPSEESREYFFAHNAQQASQLIQQHVFHYIFMDLKLPDSSGLEVIESQKKLLVKTKVVLCTGFKNYSTVESMRKAATVLTIHGIIQKTYSAEMFSELFDYLNRNLGQPYLCSDTISILSSLEEIPITKREEEILQLISSGLTTKEIASRLLCSHETVKSHRSNMLNKTKMRNVAELCAWYSERYGKSNLGT